MAQGWRGFLQAALAQEARAAQYSHKQKNRFITSEKLTLDR